MSINATILGQMITFGIFVLFTMKVVWPILDKALTERKNKIAEGLSAAEQGHIKLKNAKTEADEYIQKAKKQAAEILMSADKQSRQIVDNAKLAATQKKDSILISGKKQLEHEVYQAKIDLQNQMADLIMQGVNKIISREIKNSDHEKIIGDLSKKL